MSMIANIRTFAVAATAASAMIFAAAAASAHQSAEAFEELPVYVSNDGGEFAIEEIYMSPVEETETWGPNLISAFDVFPGEYTEVVPVLDYGGCDFDVLLVFEDGYEMTIDNVDFCEIVEIATDGHSYGLYSI